MGSGCEYEQEDFCIFEDVEGFDAKCRFKGENNQCTAKPSDLTEVCEMCGSQDCTDEECLVTENTSEKGKV
jgi:hypothetical protein